MDVKKQKLFLEHKKCRVNPAYAIESYFETFDKTNEGFVPFNLFEPQKELIHNYEKHRYNLVKKYRQAGITTVTSAYCAVKTGFAPSSNPEKILILANKQDTAISFLTKITTFVKQIPEWANVTFTKESKLHTILNNGSECFAVATSNDALRGFTPTILILDEAAFIEGGATLWSACLASVSTGGKIYLISTPNGLDEIYYAQYEGAINKDNDFHITELDWIKDPRFNKDLKLVKCKNMVDWIQQPESERDSHVIENALSLGYDEIKRLRTEEGYKPHSSWYDKMCRDMNFNKKMISQELESNFEGSGNTVVDGADIQRQEQTNVKEPIIKDKEWDNNLWIWVLPQKGHRYIAALDPSRGDAGDYCGFCIIDFDTFEQVLEYHGKVAPEIAAEIVDKYGKMYNAFTTFDLTGGYSVGCTNRLRDLKYPTKQLHYDTIDADELFFGASNGKNPGINFASKNRRILIVSALIDAVTREGFKIRSERLIMELKKFIYKNGKPDHMKTSHDDLIMALGMCLYVANTNFKELNKNDNSVKAMLDSWKIISTDSPAERTFNNMNVDSLSMVPDLKKTYENTGDVLKYTRDYGWLFS